MEERPLLEVKGLHKTFRVRSDKTLFPVAFEAVRDVSFRVARGRTFGLVGESGCGKSTVARMILLVERPSSGEILLDGCRLDALGPKALSAIRPRFQMVFQDSASSLNPRKTVREQLVAPLTLRGGLSRSEARAQAGALLDQVRLPAGLAGRYPHELSGGQRQRVCIARALALRPDLLVLDEPVSALDVSVQAQILNLLKDLQRELHLTCVFIGHGLGTVRYISHDVAVMYAGRIVEIGPADALFEDPAHPYTRALIDAAPSADPAQRDRARIVLPGEVTRDAPAQACPLIRRCPFADDACARSGVSLRPLPGRTDRWSACTRAWKEASKRVEIPS